MSEKLTLSPTMGRLQPSLTLEITAQAKAMKAKGIDVLSLCAGEPDFDTPQHIKDAAAASLAAGETKYTPSSGRADLRQAIAEKLTNENGVPSQWNQVIVSPGAKFSVFAAIAALCSDGDEVIIPSPYWLSYPEMVTAAGARNVYVPTQAQNDFCVTAAELEGVVTERTKLLILNSPSNPTGGMYTRKMLEDIAELAVRRNFMVISDEIYEKLVYDPDRAHISIASLNPQIADLTITVNGFSKAYSMTGWRLGYLSAPLWLAKAIAALQSHTTSNATTFAQAGAMAALQGDQAAVETMRQAFAVRRDLIYKLLHDIPGINCFRPQGAFYIFPDISRFGLDSMTFAKRALEEANLAVIPGKPFGMDTHIRLSYACHRETIEKSCERLANFVDRLR